MQVFYRNTLLLAGTGFLLPLLSPAQDTGPGGLAGDLGALQNTLEQVYLTMIAKCGELIGIGQAIGGLGGLVYIAYRVWGGSARAKGIDVFSLLRPFAIGIVLMLYPAFIGLLNGVLQPTVSGTASLVTDSNQAIATLLQQKQQALEQSTDWQQFVGPDGNGDQSKWEQYSGNTGGGVFSGVSNFLKFEMAKASYNLKNSIKVWLSEVLEVLFESAALCLNTVRTFYLIVLAILGPLVLGISVWDGFHPVLQAWIARYINVFLWLPVANIFGSLIGQVQQQMIKVDITQVQATGQTTFGSTDAAYIVFLVLGIAGYLTVPSITNHIITAFPVGGNHLRKISAASGSGDL